MYSVSRKSRSRKAIIFQFSVLQFVALGVIFPLCNSWKGFLWPLALLFLASAASLQEEASKKKHEEEQEMPGQKTELFPFQAPYPVQRQPSSLLPNLLRLPPLVCFLLLIHWIAHLCSPEFMSSDKLLDPLKWSRQSEGNSTGAKMPKDNVWISVPLEEPGELWKNNHSHSKVQLHPLLH